MKASEMTNEELASSLVGTIGYHSKCCQCVKCALLREAAARLRNTDTDVAFANACADETSDDCDAALVASEAEVSDLRRRIKVAEDALERSPCGEVYQLGLVDDDGNCYNGIAIKFDEAEGLKLPPVGHGDRFVVVPYSAIAAIRKEGGAK